MSRPADAAAVLLDAEADAELPAVLWCSGGRTDPITGLVAFPDFHAWFPGCLRAAVASGATVGLAIGDVDNLKEYVEGTNRSDASSFGHLAGYAVMSRLGAVARAWFWEQAVAKGCVSTFGGDEIIIALEIPDLQQFVTAVSELRHRLNEELPRTVSFALGAISVAGPTESAPRGWDGSYLDAMNTLDRHLFQSKAHCRRIGRVACGFLQIVDLTAATPVVPP